MTHITPEDFSAKLSQAIDTQDEDQFYDIAESVRTARSFKESGVITDDAGFVVRMADGSEFQITIIKSR